MVKILEDAVIKFCENLPFDVALFEENGLCVNPNDKCRYCNESDRIYFCNKKTYTPVLNLRTTG